MLSSRRLPTQARPPILKKRSKRLSPLLSRRFLLRAPEGTKVFWSFLSKKNCLPCLAPANNPACQHGAHRRLTAASLLLVLSGCGFPPPESKADREVLTSCRQEADRVYNTQNRYQLSEQDSRDSPFSGGTQAATPSQGLADQYSHEQAVSDCVRHGNAGTEALPDPASAPAAAPASGNANRP